MAIVSCGTMQMELDALKKEGFLDTDHLFFTPPGLHQDVIKLEERLIATIDKARKKADKVIVVYGGKFCYVNADNPTRTMQEIIETQGPQVARINATHCMDMVADASELKRIAGELAGDELLDYCDWMGIPMQAYPVTLDRFKSLLSDQAVLLNSTK
jgi:hypothetical protein